MPQDFNKPSGSQPNRLPRYTAAVLSVLSLVALTACNDKDVEAQPQPSERPSEPVATAPVTPGEAIETPTPTTESTPEPSIEAPSEQESPSAKPGEGDEVRFTTPDGEVMTRDEFYDHFDSVMDRYRAMPLEEFQTLPVTQRDEFLKYDIAYNLPTIREGSMFFDTEANPGLYKYNPFEASPSDTPEEAFYRYLYARQRSLLTPTVGDSNSFNREDAWRLAAGTYLHIKFDANGYPIIDKEGGEQIGSWANREELSIKFRQIENGWTGDRWGMAITESYRPIDDPERPSERSEEGYYTYTKESEEITLPAAVYAYEVTEPGKDTQRRSVTLVYENGLWKLVDQGRSHNFQPAEK